MPIFELMCMECGKVQEVFAKKPPVKEDKCSCGGTLKPIISCPAVSFEKSFIAVDGKTFFN